MNNHTLELTNLETYQVVLNRTNALAIAKEALASVKDMEDLKTKLEDLENTIEMNINLIKHLQPSE